MHALTTGLDRNLEAIVGREAHGRGDITGMLGMDDGGGELTVFRQRCGHGDFLVGKDGEDSVWVELHALVESQIPQGAKGSYASRKGPEVQFVKAHEALCMHRPDDCSKSS